MSNSGFRKSSYSNLECVEVAFAPDGAVTLRNSRHPDALLSPFTADEWVAFIAGVNAGEFSSRGEVLSYPRPHGAVLQPGTPVPVGPVPSTAPDPPGAVGLRVTPL